MMRRASLAIAVLVFFTLATPHAAGPRGITETDLLKFTWIADPQISPDGTTVAFVRVTVNEKENRYETSIYAAPSSGTEAPRRLTSGIRDTSPRWAPDGKRLALVRSIEKDGKTQPAQIYVLNMEGGEARAVTALPRGGQRADVGARRQDARVQQRDGTATRAAGRGRAGRPRRAGGAAGRSQERRPRDHAGRLPRQRQPRLCGHGASLAHLHH